MKNVFHTKFMGENVDIVLTNDEGDFLYKYEKKLPHGFVWNLDFFMNDGTFENVRSVIKSDDGNIISEEFERYVPYENHPWKDYFTDIIRDTFNSFDSDLKAKLKSAESLISSYKNMQ